MKILQVAQKNFNEVEKVYRERKIKIFFFLEINMQEYSYN